jgi:disulfide bond formation protein DsbB
MPLNAILDRWRLAALIASAVMLAIAHGFQTFGGYAPCTLCLRQREVYWVAATLSFGLMIFLVGAGIAIYHAGAEWKFWPGPSACSSAGAGGVSAADLKNLLNGAKIRPPACDQAPWVFAGLSMAGWNAVASLGLATLSVAAALRERSRS